MIAAGDGSQFDVNAWCPSLPPFPDWAESSETYRTLVNEALAKTGMGISWKRDRPGGKQNYPDVGHNAGVCEVVVPDVQWKKYVTTGHSQEGALKLLRADLCAAMASVETRRRAVACNGFQKWIIGHNPTVDRYDRLNPAVFAWMKASEDPLTLHVDQVYAKQSTFEYESYREWMEAYGDHCSRRQFARVLTPDVDTAVEGKTAAEVAEINKYANVFPWFPAKPIFSAMWPRDFTKEELIFINGKFDKFALIRMPYSVIERMSAEEASQFKPEKNKHGQVVVEVVQGLEDRWYKVTNMAFHPRYRPHFLAIAQTLRRYVDISVRGGGRVHRLPKDVRKYTLDIAANAEDGDFIAWLKADLNQPFSELFLSIFPHEGYWDDGVKYPLMMQLGIRERGDPKDAPLLAKITDYLEERSARVLGPINGYKRRTFNTAKAMEQGAVLVWHERAAGFLGAVPNTEVAGNDYPKRSYPGIDEAATHRNVAWLDSIIVAAPFYQRYAESFLPPDFTQRIPWDGSRQIDMSVLHETAHAVAMRPQDRTAEGPTFSDAYLGHWAMIAEPLAEWGAVAGWAWAYQEGLITKERAEGIFYTEAFKMLRNAQPKDAMTTDDALAGSSQIVAVMAQLGALTAGGAIHMLSDKSFVLDLDAFARVAGEKFDEVNAFTGRNALVEYKEFTRAEIRKTPDDVLDYLLAVKRRGGRPLVLVNRGRTEE